MSHNADTLNYISNKTELIYVIEKRQNTLKLINLRRTVLTFCGFSCLALMSLTPTKSFASGIEKNSGFLDFNYYYKDNRDFNTLTINALANLKHRFQYFSLTNYSNVIDATDNTDLTGYFSEQNLRWAIFDKSPYDLTAQWVTRSGLNNDILRFGLRFRLTSMSWFKNFAKKINLFYSINVHLAQFDKISGFNWQLEHVFYLRIFPSYLNNRFYISGFLDHNISSNGSKVVTEQQLGYRVIDNFYLVVENRHNGFLSEKKQGFGFGAEYKIIF